jgi:hypothetical protein
MGVKSLTATKLIGKMRSRKVRVNSYHCACALHPTPYIGFKAFLVMNLHFDPQKMYKGSPTSTVSTNTNSTSTNFSAIGN